MPIQNLDERKKYARQQYLKHKETYLARSTARRLRIQAEKSLLPKPEIIKRPCITCSKTRLEAVFPVRGNKCKPCISAFNAQYRTDNAERISASKKAWALKNKDRKAQMDREYAINNPEARRKARAKWDQNNPGLTTAAKAKNKTERKHRVPAWLTEDDHWMIAQAYELASLRTKMFGFPWHVDHIIPLTGKKVSGLHVPANLQVIPAIENLRKSNRWHHG